MCGIGRVAEAPLKRPPRICWELADPPYASEQSGRGRQGGAGLRLARGAGASYGAIENVGLHELDHVATLRAM